MIRLTILAALVAGTPALAQVAIELGPAPTSGFGGATGRVRAVACSRVDPNLYYIGSADGGVWRTRDGGDTWTPLTDMMPTTATGAIALDPSNESIVYVGSGEASFANHSRYGLGMYKSTDGGDTWRVLGADLFSGRCFSRIIVHPTNGDIVYAAVTGAGGGPERFAAKNHPRRWDPRGLYKSLDGGETWTRLEGIPDADLTDLDMDPGDPETLLAGVGDVYGNPLNGVYKTTDGGATWTRLTNGIPSDTAGRITLRYAPSNRNRIFAMIASPSTGIGVGGSSSGGGTLLGARRSNDGGATWASISVPSNVLGSQGFYDSVLIVHPTNANLAFFGGVNLVRTQNAGSSFTSHNGGHPDHHSFAWDAAGRLVIGNDGGVYRVTDPLAWSAVSRNAGLGTIQFYAGLSATPANEDHVFGGMQDNGSARRNGASLTWSSLTGGDGGWTQVKPDNPSIVFTSSQGAGVLYRSINGGFNFSSVNTGITGRHCFLPPMIFDRTNPDRALRVTERVWESLDGGLTWEAISEDQTSGGIFAIRAMALSQVNPMVVYIATNDGMVKSSTDGGRTFTLRLDNHRGWPRVTREITIDPRDPYIVYLAGATFGAPHVRRSLDGGATWEVLDGDLPDRPVNVIDLDVRYPTARLFAGTDAGLYMSRDDGRTWRRHGENIPNVGVIDLILEPQRGRMIVATQGRGAWMLALPCPADFNGDGQVDFFDYLDFVSAFAAEDPSADFNGDGQIDFFDYLDFVAAFAAGCE